MPYHCPRPLLDGLTRRGEVPSAAQAGRVEGRSPQLASWAIIVLVALLPPSVARAAAGGEDVALERALPRVVKLYGLGAGAEAGYGSGILVSPDGKVLTVLSLLIDARNIRAVLADGTTCQARVLRRDEARQLALLQLQPAGLDENATAPPVPGPSAPPPLPPLPCFDVNKVSALAPGDWVLAAGNAFRIADGAEPVSAARGVFAARTRLDARRRLADFPYHGDVLVIDAITSNPGMPGGALLNLDGDLVGMIGREVIANPTHTHLNYAVPRDVLAAFLAEAISPAPSMPPSVDPAADSTLPPASPSAPAGLSTVDLGFRIVSAGYRKVLPFVERVTRGSPAARAGLRPDDLILSINGRQTPDVETLEGVMKRLVPGEPIELVIRRDREILSIRIEAEKRESGP